MNISEVGRLRGAGRHMAFFAELLARTGDLGGARIAERQAREAQRLARMYDKPARSLTETPRGSEPAKYRPQNPNR